MWVGGTKFRFAVFHVRSRDVLESLEMRSHVLYEERICEYPRGGDV